VLPHSYRPSALSLGAAGFGGAVAMKAAPKNAGGVRSERPPLPTKVRLCACAGRGSARACLSARAFPQAVSF